MTDHIPDASNMVVSHGTIAPSFSVDVSEPHQPTDRRASVDIVCDAFTVLWKHDLLPFDGRDTP
jgi:hypothetical protein